MQKQTLSLRDARKRLFPPGDFTGEDVKRQFCDWQEARGRTGIATSTFYGMERKVVDRSRNTALDLVEFYRHVADIQGVQLEVYLD